LSFRGGKSPEESLIAGFKEKKEERRGFFADAQNDKIKGGGDSSVAYAPSE